MLYLPSDSSNLDRVDIVRMLYLVSSWIEENQTHNVLTLIELDRLALEIHDMD